MPCLFNNSGKLNYDGKESQINIGKRSHAPVLKSVDKLSKTPKYLNLGTKKKKLFGLLNFVYFIV